MVLNVFQDMLEISDVTRNLMLGIFDTQWHSDASVTYVIIGTDNCFFGARQLSKYVRYSYIYVGRRSYMG